MHDLQMTGRVLKKMTKYTRYPWYRILKINDTFNEILHISWNIGRVAVRHIFITINTK